MKAEAIEIREIELPLVHFFETSFNRIYTRRILLARVFADGIIGFGECTAPEAPYYNHETVQTAWHVIESFIVPQLLRREVGSASEISALLKRIRGHNMAKAGIEGAFWDLESKVRGLPLYRLIGGAKTKIPCGVSIGIQDSIGELLDKISTELEAGYRRIKLKIKPGWDYQMLLEVRKAFPQVNVMVDANSAYSITDTNLFRELDRFNLMMIEQPLDHDDIVDHARLQREIVTPICLDESITNVNMARKAIELGSCKIINIKLGRVGGFTEAKKIHDFCYQQGIPVWCGGMLESGIGRAHNIALSTLPGFALPGDVSASKRYYERDVVDPPIVVDPEGMIEASNRTGFGYAPDLERIDRATIRKQLLK